MLVVVPRTRCGRDREQQARRRSVARTRRIEALDIIIVTVPNPTWLFVAVVYAAAVWLARRARVELPWRHAVGFYLLVLLFLWRPMTGPYVSYPSDVIRLLPPWSNVLPPNRPPVTKYEVSNLNTHDAPMQLIPWAYQVRQSWRSLHVPLWNAEAGCGYPLLANGQSSALSPLRILALPLPFQYAVTAEAAMKLLIALTCMYVFCRRRYGEAASIAAAISFGFCTYIVAWLHFAHITSAVFLPAVLLGIDLLADRFTPQRFAFAACSFALTALAGHPETAIHIAMLAIPFALWVTLVERGVRVRGLVAIAGAGVVAILLAAPFLFPFIEALRVSQRYQELRVTPNRATPFSDFLSATLLVEPSITGHLPVDRPWGPTTIESITGFAGIFGLIAFVAVTLQTIARRGWRATEVVFIVMTVFALGAVLDWRFVSAPLYAVLGTVAHARLRFILCAVLSLHIASAIDGRRESPVFILIGTAAASAVLLYLMKAIPFPTPGARDTALIAMAPSILVVAAATAFAVAPRAVAALIVTAIMELFIVNAGWNPSLPLRTAYPRTPLIAALEHLRARETQPFRISGIGSALYPNTNAMFGFEDTRVHDPMAYGRYLGFLRELSRYDPSDYYAKWNDADSPLVDLLNVRYMLADRGADLLDPSRYELVYDGSDGRIYRNRSAMPRFFAVRNVIVAQSTEAFIEQMRRIRQWDTAVVRDPVRVGAGGAVVAIERSAHDMYRLRVHASAPTLIASSIALYPGWHIQVNDSDVAAFEVNGPFLGFVVPAGEAMVTVRYRPFWFYAGVAAAALGIALLLCVQLLHRRRP